MSLAVLEQWNYGHGRCLGGHCTLSIPAAPPTISPGDETFWDVNVRVDGVPLQALPAPLPALEAYGFGSRMRHPLLRSGLKSFMFLFTWC